MVCISLLLTLRCKLTRAEKLGLDRRQTPLLL
jgi:hypothetical protein